MPQTKLGLQERRLQGGNDAESATITHPGFGQGFHLESPMQQGRSSKMTPNGENDVQRHRHHPTSKDVGNDFSPEHSKTSQHTHDKTFPHRSHDSPFRGPHHRRHVSTRYATISPPPLCLPPVTPTFYLHSSHVATATITLDAGQLLGLPSCCYYRTSPALPSTGYVARILKLSRMPTPCTRPPPCCLSTSPSLIVTRQPLPAANHHYCKAMSP